MLRWCRYQLNPLYVLITVVAYMMKDRIKEWGKRYLQPVCVKFGFEFPDRIVKVSGNCDIAVTCDCRIRNGPCQTFGFAGKLLRLCANHHRFAMFSGAKVPVC